MLVDRIEKYLAINNMNKRDLASKIGVQESLLSKWLAGDKITAAFLYKLVDFWPDIDLNYIVKGDSVNEYEIIDTTAHVSEGGTIKNAEILYHTKQIEKHLEAINKLAK